MHSSRIPFLLCAILIPACQPLEQHNAEKRNAPLFTQCDIFTAGENGYYAYRIPAIQSAPDGSLLAFAEARKYNLSDPGEKNQDIDLVVKRSADVGRTWSPMKIIEDPGEKWSAGNPATLVDRDTKLVWLFYLRGKPGRNTYTARPGTDDVQTLARTSADNGQTWSDPIDLTAITRDMADAKWRTSVIGPGGAFQTRTGRLIIPVWKFEPWAVFALFSDDHGQSWQRSQFVPDAVGDECQLVELSDGQIMFDIRQQKGATRLRSISTDGGQSWSTPIQGEKVSPVCCAIERLPKTAENPDEIIWTGPRGPNRNNLVIRISQDNAQSFPVERSLYIGRSAYSDLTLLKDSTIGVIYERGQDRDYEFITFIRFNHAWLTAPP